MDLHLDYNNFESLKTHLSDDRLRAAIKLLAVFGCNGQEVIYATDDDMVYGYGRNRLGGLGLGHTRNDVETPELNVTLSGQQVVDIVAGFEHWTALTATGQLYVWGRNNSGQLAIENMQTSSATPLVVEALRHLTLVQVSCGGFHTLALTIDGRVYGWGRNVYGQVGKGSAYAQCSPVPIEFEAEIISISCGGHHSLALSIDGEVLVWGHNDEGQLGCDTRDLEMSNEPLPVPSLRGLVFTQVVCGLNHSLLLTNDGFCYAFGDNSCGQIGNGQVGQQSIPFRIECGFKFKEIVVHKENELSIAVATDDEHYAWGLVKNRRITSPTIVSDNRRESTFDVYGKCAKTKVTYKTIVGKQVMANYQLAPTIASSSPNCLSGDVIPSLTFESANQETVSSIATSSTITSGSGSTSRKTIDDILDLSRLLEVSLFCAIDDNMRKSIRLLKVFGENKAIFVTYEDNVYGIGRNNNGSLGLGTNAEFIRSPQLNRFLSGKHLIDIAHGFEHCVGLTSDGLCYAWGANIYGQLGYETEKRDSKHFIPSDVPKLIESIADIKMIQVYCSPYHSLALSADGQVFAWGYNTFGQLGDKTYTSRVVPVQVLLDEPVASVCCGRASSLALTTSGQVYVWGINEMGQLGRPRERDIRPNREKAVSNWPKIIAGLSQVIVKAVCGPNHTLLLTSEGDVFGFGENNNGQVGNDSTETQFTPIKLNPNSLKIKDIFSFWENDLSIAISEDNRYYVWGLVQKRELRLFNELVTRPRRVSLTDERSLFDLYVKCAKSKVTFKTVTVDDDFAQLFPNPTSESVFVSAMNSRHNSSMSWHPFKPSLVKNHNITESSKLSATLDDVLDINLFPILNTTLTNDHTKSIRLLAVFGYNGTEVIFVTHDDQVYGFGLNKAGCLGLSTVDQHICEPRLNKTLSDKGLQNIFYSFEFCIGLTGDGQCYAWGQNCFGQLGIGTKVSTPVPQLIAYLSKKKIVAISCGQNHALALTDEGKLYSWGHNMLGQLGDATYEDRLLPTPIQVIHQIISISCGRNHSAAVTKNRFIYFWGNNEFGQLGREPKYDYRAERKQWVVYKPMLNRSFKNISKVSKAVCGQNYSLFLTVDSDVYAFGDNSCGQIGNGSTDTQITPSKISGIKFKDIIAVKESVLCIGLSTDNLCYVWGFADFKNVMTPKVVTEWPDQSMHNIFAKYSRNKVTHKTVILDEDIVDVKRQKRFSLKKLEVESNSCLSSLCGKESPELDADSEYMTGNDNNSFEESIFGTVSSVRTCATDSIAINSLTDSLKNSFNDENTADMEIIIGDQKYYCHRKIIELRNAQFWRLVSQDSEEDNRDVDTSFSNEAFLQFLRYLYGIDPEVDENNVIDLRSMAETFGEKALFDHCSDLMEELQYRPNLMNVCTLYEKAISDGLPDLEKSCVEFAADNWKNVCKTDAFQTMDDRLSKDLMLSVFNLNV